jgi:hypothetical protein
MMSGPATRNGREPIRPAIVPTRVDSRVSRIPDVLEEEPLVGLGDVEGAVHEERHEIDRREGPLPEEAEWDERVGPACHEHREHGERDGTDGQRDPGDQVSPGLLLAANGTERQAADRERGNE